MAHRTNPPKNPFTASQKKPAKPLHEKRLLRCICCR
jgi:hypothetical protein